MKLQRSHAIWNTPTCVAIKKEMKMRKEICLFPCFNLSKIGHSMHDSIQFKFPTILHQNDSTLSI